MTEALWITAAGKAELRPVTQDPKAGDTEVQTLFSGISRGTERLIFNGHVPEGEHDTMRAPFQEGHFTFPVKYGYSAVGRALSGPHESREVFALFPHQTWFRIPSTAAFPLPDAVPASRAILAANMETALNIIWDAGLSAGDRVAVVGAGAVGALAAYLAARMPGAEVCLIDTNPGRATLAERLGCTFARPEAAPSDAAPSDADVVIHASASEAGLATAIALAGVEARIIEASWYGAGLTQAPLGGRFHQRRLQITASQVGRIPAHRAARWSLARRLSKALDLLADPALDAMISGETAFSDLADDYGAVLSNPDTLCHRVRYTG